MKLKVKKLYDDAELPSRVFDTDAGWDLFTHHIEDCGFYIKVYTGIAIEPDYDYYTTLYPRSSIYKYGLMLYNSIGLIDFSYRGEIIGILYKTADYSQPGVGARLLQLVVQKSIPSEIIEVEQLTETKRGTGGLGSSGI